MTLRIKAVNTGPEIGCELVIPLQLLKVDENVADGQIVSAIRQPWIDIFTQVTSDPAIFSHFSKHPRAFEEFIASSYNRAGFLVTLTPRSGDLGRDIIAEKAGFASIRILDQCKAFSKGNTVGPNDVRAMMGSLSLDQNASKAIISTTSTFAPSVRKEWAGSIPYRLELREGPDIMDWVRSIRADNE